MARTQNSQNSLILTANLKPALGAMTTKALNAGDFILQRLAYMISGPVNKKKRDVGEKLTMICFSSVLFLQMRSPTPEV